MGSLTNSQDIYPARYIGFKPWLTNPEASSAVHFKTIFENLCFCVKTNSIFGGFPQILRLAVLSISKQVLKMVVCVSNTLNISSFCDSEAFQPEETRQTMQPTCRLPLKAGWWAIFRMMGPNHPDNFQNLIWPDSSRRKSSRPETFRGKSHTSRDGF